MARVWTTYDWIKLVGAIVLLVLLLWCLGRPGRATAGAPTLSAPAQGTLRGPTVDLSGTGTPGGFIQPLLNGARVGNPIRIGADGTWTLPGFSFGAPGNYTLTLQPVDARGNQLAPGSNFTFTVPPVLSIGEPADGAQLPAGTFQLRGTGVPGERLEVFEDETSLGEVTVSPDGTWTLAVPSPTGGRHRYEVRGGGGSARIEVSVEEVGFSATSCNKAFSLSIAGNQTVSRPFRFGGEGSGPGYAITVRRGDRVVGTRELKLDSTCAFSYRSDPGPGAFTYEVRPLEASPSDPPLQVITLTVR